MKNFLYYIFIATIVVLSSCSNDPKAEPSASLPETPPSQVEFTLFMYMPWSQNLTTDLQKNLNDMQSALAGEHFPGKRVVAFISSSSTEAHLIEITSGKRKTLKTYTSPNLTTTQGIASILEDVKTLAPAHRYAMTVGCHGTGWLPVGALENTPNRSVQSYYANKLKHPVTRYFGGINPEWQTDVSTLANALESANIHLEYLLFDVCYMGCVEVAYELRNVADITVLSPTEIMGIGMPYNTLGTLLMHDNIDWQMFCNNYLDFFASYTYPYGTISVIDNHYLEPLAEAMQQLDNRYDWTPEKSFSLQAFGGFYGENIFFDLGQYADILSQGNNENFTTVLRHTVIASAHTESCYVYLYGTIHINHYSGISTSAPSTSAITSSWNSTGWAVATQKQ